MANKRFNLDLFKDGYTTKSMLTRKGEKGQKIEINVTENGQASILTGATLKLKGVNSKDQYTEVSGIVQSGIVVITIPQNWNAEDGTFKECYLEVTTTGSSATRITTQSVSWLVLPEATVTGSTEAHYIDRIEKLIESIQNQVNTALTLVNQQIEAVENHIDSIDTELVAIDGRIATMNQLVQDALEEFENGDFYTKAESDARFALKSDVPTLPIASTSQQGIVQLSNATTSTSQTLASTPNAVNTLRQQVATNYFFKTNPVKESVPASVNFLGTQVQKQGVEIATINDVTNAVKKASWLIINHNGDGIITTNSATALVPTIYSTDSNVTNATSTDGNINVTSNNRINFTRDMVVRVSSTITLQGVTNGVWKDARFRLFNSGGTLKTSTGLARVRQRSGQAVIDWASLGGTGVVQVSSGDYIELYCNGDITSGNIQVMNVSVNEIV